MLLVPKDNQGFVEMNFPDFETMDFPQKPNLVYVLGVELEGGKKFHPFYVGQTSRHIGRIGDYVSAKFTASTDYKVGETVKYLLSRGLRVKVKFKEFDDPLKDEAALIRKIQEHKVPLLNDLPGYDYRVAHEEVEREKVRIFVDDLLKYVNVP
jgi:hypothetical protein